MPTGQWLLYMVFSFVFDKISSLIQYLLINLIHKYESYFILSDFLN